MFTLKRNMISLGKLMKDGYSFKGNGIELKITRVFRVCFKGEIKYEIYILKGGMNIPMVVVGEMENVSMIQLWHMRLAHISIKRVS